MTFFTCERTLLDDLLSTTHQQQLWRMHQWRWKIAVAHKFQCGQKINAARMCWKNARQTPVAFTTATCHQLCTHFCCQCYCCCPYAFAYVVTCDRSISLLLRTRWSCVKCWLFDNGGKSVCPPTTLLHLAVVKSSCSQAASLDRLGVSQVWCALGLVGGCRYVFAIWVANVDTHMWFFLVFLLHLCCILLVGIALMHKRICILLTL